MDKIAWLNKLIAFDTTSRGSNLALIDAITSWCKQYRTDLRITRDLTDQKANLFVTLAAENNSLEGGLVLSGHTDVVPIDGQKWHTHPFTAIHKENKIFGRGAADMKGFIAVVLALLPVFSSFKLKRPLHFAFTYDEEVGCHGAKLMLADLPLRGIKPRVCIVGEPTEMHVVVGHKGIAVFRCRVYGCAAHSSLTPKGCNAIDYAAKMIAFIRDISDQLRIEGPFDSHYDVPFTSISTNHISGGTANNIIPELCEFIFECRHLPTHSPHSLFTRIIDYAKTILEPSMKKEYSEAAIEIDFIASVPGFETSIESSIFKLASAIHNEKEVRKVAYATEAGLFQNTDIQTIICGPGSIEQAHRPNEFVTIQQLEKCEQFLKQIVNEYCLT